MSVQDPQEPRPEKEKPHELYFVCSAVSVPKRPNEPNEDAHFVEPHEHVYGVFDGMGGLDHAALASQIARDVILKQIQDIPEVAESQSVRDILRSAFDIANSKIVDKCAALNAKKMGTTATVLVLRKFNNVWRGVIAHTGDSRLYRVRSGVLTCLTRDHGALYAMNQLYGVIGYDEIASALDDVENPSLITNETLRKYFTERTSVAERLGEKDRQPRVDITLVDVQDNDLFILCSDGVSDNLTRTQMEMLARSNTNPAMLAMMLVDNAKHIASFYKGPELGDKRAKPDDMTAVVVAAHAR